MRSDAAFIRLPRTVLRPWNQPLLHRPWRSATVAKSRISGTRWTARTGAAPCRGRKEVIVKTFGLFVITAVAEILGCYLPYLWLRKEGSAWLLVPAVAFLLAFAWLLSLHPTAAGRVYAAYGGVYVSVAVMWLWLIDGQRPSSWDLIGAAVAIAGMAIIMFGPRQV